MIVSGQVGALATTQSLAAGQQPLVRLGNMGDLVVQELHGRYYEAAYRKTGFVAASPAAVTTTAFATGVTVTLTGLNISNPINSTVNLVLNKVGIAFLVAFAAAAEIGLAVGFNSGTNVTHTTALTTRSTFVGFGGASAGLVDSVSTFPTAPNTIMTLGAGLTGAITTVPYVAPIVVDLEGSIILPPGAYAAIVTSTAGGATGFMGSFSWEEVPL